MKKLINIILISLFLSTQVLATDREVFLKKIKKNPYVKETEWLSDKTFLAIVDSRVTSSDFNSALNRICKLAKKHSIKAMEEVQIAYKKSKILKTKKCK